MSFLIKKDSQSFQYLSRWKSNYKRFAKDGQRETHWGSRNIANDFCSYYRHVAGMMFWHFCLLLVVPSFFIGILIIFGGIYIPPVPTLVSVLWIISAVPALLVCFIGICYMLHLIATYVWPVIVNGIRYILPKRKPATKVLKEKQPSVLSVWYDGFKHNYCHTIEFEAEVHDQAVHSE